MTQEDEPPHVGNNMLPGKRREVSAPERMKRLDQSRNGTQLWMRPVVKVKSDAVKNKIS